MSQYTKRKGTVFENEVRDFLRTVFPGCERAPRWGSKDQGDLTGTGAFTVEVKNCKSITLAEFVDEAVEENLNSGRRWPVVFAKRRRKSVADAYVVLPAHAFRDLVAELQQYQRAEGHAA